MKEKLKLMNKFINYIHRIKYKHWLNGKTVDRAVNSSRLIVEPGAGEPSRLVGDSSLPFSGDCGAFRAHKCNAIIYKSAAENITQK